MTLKEKIAECIDRSYSEDVANNVEGICKDFAIKFAEWVNMAYSKYVNNRLDGDNITPIPFENMTNREVLEKFKTEVYEQKTT